MQVAFEGRTKRSQLARRGRLSARPRRAFETEEFALNAGLRSARRPGIATISTEIQAGGALGGTRTPTILLTATSRQRVYQFRHERFGDAGLRLEGRPDQRRRSNKSIRGVQACRGPEFHKLCRKVPAPASIGHLLVTKPVSRAKAATACPGLLPGPRRARQHLLDLDGDPVAVDQDDPGGHRQIVRQHLDLVRLSCVQFDDGAAGKTQYLMDRHGGRPQDDHEIHGDFIESGHCQDRRNIRLAFAPAIITTLWLANG